MHRPTPKSLSSHESIDSIGKGSEARCQRISELSEAKSFSSKRVTLDLEGEDSALKPATQADLEYLLQKVQQHMNQVKNDLLAEQRPVWKTLLGGVSTIPEDSMLPVISTSSTNDNGVQSINTNIITASVTSASGRRKKVPTGPRRLSLHRSYSNSLSAPAYESHGSKSSAPVSPIYVSHSSKPGVGSHMLGSQRSETSGAQRNSRISGNINFSSMFASKKRPEPKAIQKERSERKRKSRFGHEQITQMTDIHTRGGSAREVAKAVSAGSNGSEAEGPKEEQLTGYTLYKQRFDGFVLHPAFDAACGMLILVNAVLIGAETEVIAQGGDPSKFFEIIQYCLNGWYLIELCLRLSAQGWHFIHGEERNWNMFDSFLVASALLDLFLTSFASDSLKTARVLRVIRLFRIVRTLRIIRQFKYVREFRKMVSSLLASVQTLFWSLLLVFGVMYTFALWFTQSAADFRKDNAENPEMLSLIIEIESYYDSFSRTVFSLFAAISGGYSWHVLVDPWIAADENMSVFFFFCYISIAVFGLMNIVTSVFVESAMHATKHFQDLLVDEKKKDLEMYMRHMETIFRVIDEDGGGTISFEEMAAFLEDAGSELPQYLEALGITSKDVWVLFKLLDTDDTGSIDIREFCDGCMRLKGEARSFDINCMMYESRAMIRYQADFMEFVEERFEFLEKQNVDMLQTIDSRLALRISGLSTKLRGVTNSMPYTSEGSDGHRPRAPTAEGLHEKTLATVPVGQRLLKNASFGDELLPEPLSLHTIARRGASRISQHLYHEQAAPTTPKAFFALSRTLSSTVLEAEFNSTSGGKPVTSPSTPISPQISPLSSPKSLNRMV